MTVALLAFGACRDASKASEGDAAAGPGAEFCRTLVAQFERMAKFDPSDMTNRGKYFAEQKELNAKLVKTAPGSLSGDVALATTNANAAIDAQASLNATSIKATAAVLRSPAHLAATRRMTDYCGIKATVSQ